MSDIVFFVDDRKEVETAASVEKMVEIKNGSREDMSWNGRREELEKEREEILEDLNMYQNE